jgi:hypothetical protein
MGFTVICGNSLISRRAKEARGVISFFAGVWTEKEHYPLEGFCSNNLWKVNY